MFTCLTIEQGMKMVKISTHPAYNWVRQTHKKHELQMSKFTNQGDRTSGILCANIHSGHK